VKYLATGGFWITLGRFTASGSSFLLTLVLANLVTKEAFGTYKFIQSLAGVITAFSLSGMGTAVTQAVATGNEGAVRNGFRLHLKWSAIMTFCASAAAVYYFLNDNTMIAWSLLILGIVLPFSQSGGFFSPYLIGKKEFKAETMYGIFYTVIPPIITALTALLNRNNPILLVTAFFGSTAIVAIAIYLRVIRKYNPPRNTESTQTLLYGKHLSFMNILGMISFQLDRILVFHYLFRRGKSRIIFRRTCPSSAD
jgi:O-antigen/teichoic acid export membrane protein